MKFCKNKVLPLYKFVTATLKVSCKVFLYIPNAQDPKDMYSNHTLKSEPFLHKKVSWTAPASRCLG